MTTDEFLLKCNNIHGNKYDYSQVEYINAKTKVKILFDGKVYEQLPMNHLKGQKCEMNNKLNMEIFLKRSTIIHKNKYNYDKVIFTLSTDKVKIICDIHGEYLQSK